MRLNWTYNPDTQIASLELAADPALKYETPDGGQTINKFVDGVLTTTFHIFGPDRKFLGFNSDPNCGMTAIDFDTNWPAELIWLEDTFPELVNGDSVNPNRMMVDGAYQGWDGFDIIATCSGVNEPLLYEQDMIWRKDKATGKIYRCGQGQPRIPDSMYPKIYGPFEVTLEDIADHGGTVL